MIEDKETEKYYYFHAESDTIYSSNNPPEIEIIPTCPVDHVSREFALQKMNQYEMKEIPHLKTENHG